MTVEELAILARKLDRAETKHWKLKRAFSDALDDWRDEATAVAAQLDVKAKGGVGEWTKKTESASMLRAFMKQPKRHRTPRQ
jgi:hypothetical protein